MAEPVRFEPLPASRAIRAALAELESAYIAAIATTQDDFSRILLETAARQAAVVQDNLVNFERQGSHIFSTTQNLGLLEDLITNNVARLNGPARNAAEARWTRAALDLRQELITQAPGLGIDLSRTDYARSSLAAVQVGAQNSFSELSDFANLQRATVTNLKTELADAMARGLDYRTIGKAVETTGVEALPAIPGVRRAFSLEERGRMIGRTEVVRIQTLLQAEMAKEAGLDWGRSYLNWRLQTHHEFCLWAEALGWAPVAEFYNGPGLPPRHPNCGCNWQQGLKDWIDPAEGPPAMRRDFAKNIAAEGIRLTPELVARLDKKLVAELRSAGLLAHLDKAARADQSLKAGTVIPSPPPTFAAEVQSEIGAGGVTTAEQASKVGKLVDAEWVKRRDAAMAPIDRELGEMKAQTAVFEKEADEAWRSYIKLITSVPGGTAPPPEAADLLARSTAAFDKINKSTERRMELLRDKRVADRVTLRETLAELRSMGTAEPDGGQLIAKGSPDWFAKTLSEVAKNLPTAWLEDSKARGELTGIEDKRGYYGDYGPGKTATVALSNRGAWGEERQPVAIHEMGHRFEAAVKSIVALEREFYQSRTAGESSENTLGYKKDEWFKKDRFADVYMGKDYKIGVQGYGEGYELLSMALESIFYGTYDLRGKDLGMLHWALGVLAGAK